MQFKSFKNTLAVLFIFFLSNYSMFSQTVNGKLLKEIDTHYLQVTLDSPELFDSRVNVRIDYGQYSKSRKDTFLLDENGKKILFNSFIDVSNFLYKNGFEYIDAKLDRHENPNHDSYIYTFKKLTNN